MRRTSYRSESSIPATFAATAETRLRESPEPINPAEEETGGYSHGIHEQLNSYSTPATVKHNSNPIHHHIAPAFGAPFMKAEGLVHRGIPDPTFWLLVVDCRAFGSSVYGWDGKSCPCATQVSW
jgi:hypothetical protein